VRPWAHPQLLKKKEEKIKEKDSAMGFIFYQGHLKPQLIYLFKNKRAF
jgi:hypothetical protein